MIIMIVDLIKPRVKFMSRRNIILAIVVLFYGSISAIKVSEKPIVILICAYNGQTWVNQNLDSVFDQEYANFRVIYVDDHSTDDTVKSVKEYIERKKIAHRFTLICNKERRSKLENIYNAINSCHNNEIILILDYDDWFAHTAVLKEINQLYSNNNIWLTYGQFIDYPSNEIGYSKRTPKKTIDKLEFRNSWHYMHPKTFYVWLFKLIKKEDLYAQKIPGYEGKFYPYCDDLAMMYPMLEMAKDHFAFIPKIAYVRNTQNPLSWYNDEEKAALLKQCSTEIKKRPKYKPIKK